ncbi:MAG: SLC13 family permease [Peptococcaceae bacterium]|nr:SLC13 family permease [Peptococcaceae bacterium]
MEQTNNTALRYYAKILLIAVLMFGIGFLPSIGDITPYGMKILGIFIGCIVGWGFGYQFITSIFALILLSFLGENTIDTVLSGAFGNASLVLVVFAFLFCFGIEKTGIMSYVANYILSRKFTSKGPWFISLAFWIACCVCSALITNCVPVIILMWAMFYEITEKMHVPRNHKWVQITMILLCVVGYTGSVIMPYSGWPIMAYALAGSVLGNTTINFASHTILMLVLNVAIIAVLFILCQFLLRRKLEITVSDNLISSKNLKMDKAQKLGVFYLALLGLAIFLPNIIDASVPGINILSRLSSVGCFAVICVLMCITRVDGKPLMDPVESMKNIPWSLYFLLLAALFLASLISSPETGISATIVSILNSMLGGIGVFGVIALFVAFGCLITNAINNVVCMNIFIPIGVATIVGMSGNPAVLVELLQMVLYLGLILPSGSAVGALMHGNTEWLQTKSIYKYAFLGCFVVVIVCLVIGIPLGNLLF